MLPTKKKSSWTVVEPPKDVEPPKEDAPPAPKEDALPTPKEDAPPAPLFIPAPLDDEESIRLPDGSIIDEEELSEASTQMVGGDGEEAGPPSACTLSTYGAPVSPEQAAELFPTGGSDGLTWHATLLSADAMTRDCMADGTVRPRRAQLSVRAKDFFASLVRTPDGRYLFSGVLNGWPALTCLELRSITVLKHRGSIVGGAKLERHWVAGKTSTPPTMPNGSHSVRATLRSPPWTAEGYSKGVPGFVWWFHAQRPMPSLAHGEAILAAAAAGGAGEEVAEAVRVHLFNHRYARAKPETAKDRLTYHSAILIEWSHGRHTTVVELATLNGVGGRGGKSNWYADKLEEIPALYRAMPTDMIAPYKGEFAEIRCSDVPATNLDEFKSYVQSYVGDGLRFLDPHFSLSAPVRLSHRSEADVARYLLNYMGRDRRYTEKVRNCQAFAADFFAFTAGKKGTEVFSPILRPLYTQRTHLFLYDPRMYNNPTPVEPDE